MRAVLAILAFLIGLPNPVEPPFPAGCSLAFDADGYQFVAPTAPWNGKRVYLWPGLGSTNAQWSQPIFSTLISDLTGGGYQAVLVPIPLPTLGCYFANGGWQYREQFVAQTNAIMNAVDAAHGSATQNIAGGISFGGLHAMEAFASTGRFKSWWAHVPVTYINQLSAYTSVGPVQRFNQFWDVPSFRQSKGWISYATADTTTNYVLTQQLAGLFSQAVTVQVYPGEDHSTTLQNVADIFAFLQSL